MIREIKEGRNAGKFRVDTTYPLVPYKLYDPDAWAWVRDNVENYESVTFDTLDMSRNTYVAYFLTMEDAVAFAFKWGRT
jgi:hypothetical protein